MYKWKVFGVRRSCLSWMEIYTCTLIKQVIIHQVVVVCEYRYERLLFDLYRSVERKLCIIHRL